MHRLMIATCPFLVPPSTLSSSRSLSVSLASLSSLLLSTVRLILVAPSPPPLPSSFFLPPEGEGARAILYVRELASLYKYVRDSTRRISNELAIKHHEQKNTRRGGGFKVFFSLSLSLFLGRCYWIDQKRPLKASETSALVSVPDPETIDQGKEACY